MASRIFLLSPAYAGGKRAQMILNAAAEFDLARKLRAGAATVGEVFSFISGLYFRGKVAYANTFAAPPADLAGSYVIVAGRGLVTVEEPITVADLLRIAAVPVDVDEPRFRVPLERDASLLAKQACADCEFVLLGSVATPKYVEPLVRIFGERLLFPEDFVGRGDMSRGGLMLRCAGSSSELPYAPVANAIRKGKRPPKLAKLPQVRR